MSQKKVDAYKARKSTRGRADKKEKMMFTLEMFAWAFICVVVVAWIGYSAYVKVAGTKAEVVQNTVLDTSALDNYISGIDTDEDADTTEETADETDAADTTEDENAEAADDTTATEDTADDSAETADDTAATEDTTDSAEK
ncbi:hypothetical protein G4952_10970 [Blautia wexlerae]|uniref:Uncharacterized protein n=1 Tax=Blautia wexlerae TaxID=418240 RepID=A0ABX2GPV5_9FIRM|nr:hypothetical protein [Blautia wexlerae]NSF74324.1 hypothetical protein [Blautia wexlerae]